MTGGINAKYTPKTGGSILIRKATHEEPKQSFISRLSSASTYRFV